MALAVLVLVGAILRLGQFLSDRSLWHDEALLALNLIGRSFAHSLGVLDFTQAASWPFMASSWVTGKAFGYSEESLRLIPLAAGIAATALFAVLARRALAPWTAVVATSLLVVSDGLVYYASEFKPYSSDVLVTVALLLLGVRVIRRPPGTIGAVLIGVGGAALVLASFSAVFIAGSVILVLLGQVVGRRTALAARLTVASTWGLAALVLALEARGRTGPVREAFAPASTPGSNAHDTNGRLDLTWLDSFGSGLLNAIGASEERPASQLAKLAALAALAGLVSLARRDRALAAVLLLPFLATMLASRLDAYPLTERTTLFLLPCLALLMAEGVSWPARLVRAPFGLALASALAVAVLAYPAYSAARHLGDPRVKQEAQPVLEALARAWQPGDTLYLHPRAQYAFRYYADCGCMDPALPELGSLFPFSRLDGPKVDSAAVRPTTAALIVGTTGSDRDSFRREVANRNGRLWLFASHSSGPADAEFLETDVPQVLDSLGRRLAVIRRPGATAYLYELS